MSWLTKGGIRKLSELEIDVSKDWQAREITNLKAVVAGMTKGDLTARGDSVLVRISPGPTGHVLISAGPGKLPTWQPPAGPLERWIAASLESSIACGVAGVDESHEKVISPISSYEGITTPTEGPALAATPEAAIATVNQSAGETASPVSSPGYVVMDSVGGAVSDDGGMQTDETAQANSDTANDMTLLTVVPAVDDAYYLGYLSTFPAVWLRQGVSGAGDWTIAWEYWNGAAWVALPGVEDNGGGFRPGVDNTRYRIGFSIPGDWATTTVGGIANLYWIRGRVSSFVTMTTQPRGTRAWIERASG